MILVFGKTGQVAKELQRRTKNAIFLGREDADLSDPQSCADQVTKHAPSCVINAAAYTAVDRAENEPDLAQKVNAEAPAHMAQAAQRLGIPFVHVSTDYVFDGAGNVPFQPNDPVAPLGVYGRTKLAGEMGVRDAHATPVILRTSWVFSAHGSNFVKSMLRHGAEKSEMKIVWDQIGGPTPAADIADALLEIASQRNASGTYHFSGKSDVSWADFAREIFSLADLDTRVVDIPTTDYPTPAQRPLNSRLDCSSLESAFGIARPEWRSGLQDVLKELGASA
ncbi:MAG: dTDP-4-dehydrorhamnose reductase [Paracoccaceae bacterium]